MYPEERSLVKEMQGRPFVLLGVNTDKTAKIASNAVKKNKLNWRSFFDGKSKRISSQFKVVGFPTILLIDHNGVIQMREHRIRDLDKVIDKMVSTAEADGMEGLKFTPKMRVFRDKTGKHTIEAVVDSINDEKVKLRKKEGGDVILALTDLSRSDQKYLSTVDAPELNEDSSGKNATASSGFRMFVDVTGKHKLQAKVENVSGGKVTLKRKDGTTTTMSIKSLSDADQKFIRDNH